MIKKFLKLDLMHLFLVFSIIAFAALLIFKQNTLLKINIVALTSIIYLSMALVHHYKDKTLTLEVIIEYVLIALLAIVVVSGFLI
ncbi:MAG: hypothetical protein US86_C0001G0207 [Candidatus Daviesbacteria bacterium GW2011_GWA2_38_24]|uniref:Uncharacterized protein n=1 Tax=Candidatus Daviesbacteria bacterium GW2011_GWA2_38_24 TaxID=1618422 RepID=A0A0G0JVY3_9BACT|nr:MAG: hypothetical protein US86_C0001G0207 [Candidatus Daviesbacteria bacterium GW2011_GWA2_38_24]KKQ79641.1 MAG: hypothetical protein UT01_C0032G0010 [Candidatus Daviesbacteria bacterium GW2011_GWA1_38_7]OGE23006.1 MAG: hypothetical protein A2688_03035 [Candidatus Daviesbacteria bacterium RIFCSPHIGHO2_01_FULL_38_8]